MSDYIGYYKCFFYGIVFGIGLSYIYTFPDIEKLDKKLHYFEEKNINLKKKIIILEEANTNLLERLMELDSTPRINDKNTNLSNFDDSLNLANAQQNH